MAAESTSGRPVRQADTVTVQATPGVQSPDLGKAAKPLSPDSEGFLPSSFEIFFEIPSLVERYLTLMGLELSAMTAPTRAQIDSGLVDGKPIKHAYGSLKRTFRSIAGSFIDRNNLKEVLRHRGLDNLANNLMDMVKGVPRKDIEVGVKEINRRLALQGKDK